METNKIYQGDCLEVLKTFPDNSINMVMTSPPYWALRDYNVEGQLGLEPTFNEYIDKLCNIFDEVKRVLRKDGTCWVNMGSTYGDMPMYEISLRDRAWLASLIDGEGCLQIHKQLRHNSIPSYQADISVGMRDKQMVEKAHDITNLGTLKLQNRNVWDWSIRGQEAGQLAQLIYPDLLIKKKQAKLLIEICKNTKRKKQKKKADLEYREHLYISNKKLNQRNDIDINLPEPKEIYKLNAKCDLMIPQRFAIEMVNRGWILRNVIIWEKKNCMPSSIKDRFTVDFEYLYFFVKNKKYWFEQQFDESLWADKDKRYFTGPTIGEKASKGNYAMNKGGSFREDKMRNKRCVWQITTQSYKEAHFATYPEKLCLTPIKAGCPKNGIVLDPFAGAGTTCMVAKKLNRNYIGIELNKSYIDMAEKRIETECGVLL